jgi:hypothetical protein
MAAPALWPAVLPALTLLALHHALVKASLFLGVGADRSGRLGRLVCPALVIASLALMGLPPFGGFLGKMWIDQFAVQLPHATEALFHGLLPLTSTATTILMGRFLWLEWKPAAPLPDGPATGLASPLASLLLLVLGLSAPAAAALLIGAEGGLWLDASYLWKGIWPILLGAAPVALGIWAARRGRRLRLQVPPGDLVVPLEHLAAALQRRLSARIGVRPPMPPVRLRLAPAESLLRRLSVTGVVYLALLLALSWAAGYR